MSRLAITIGLLYLAAGMDLMRTHRRLIVPAGIMVACLILLLSPAARAQSPLCEEYREEILESAWETFGPGAPTADLVAQLHQESGCRTGAVSRVGARGLAQFMPATAGDMATRYAACRPADPFEPEWAIRCRDLYMAEQLRALRASTESDHWAMALSAYNGGRGWVLRDRAACRAEPWPCHEARCDPGRWWFHVELTPDPRRAAWAVKENRGYPRRILCTLAPKYAAAGWGRTVGCP